VIISCDFAFFPVEYSSTAERQGPGHVGAVGGDGFDGLSEAAKNTQHAGQAL